VKLQENWERRGTAPQSRRRYLRWFCGFTRNAAARFAPWASRKT